MNPICWLKVATEEKRVSRARSSLRLYVVAAHVQWPHKHRCGYRSQAMQCHVAYMPHVMLNMRWSKTRLASQTSSQRWRLSFKSWADICRCRGI